MKNNFKYAASFFMEVYTILIGLPILFYPFYHQMAMNKSDQTATSPSSNPSVLSVPS